MPSEPLQWDQKEHLKERKEGWSELVSSEVTRCGPSFLPKRPDSTIPRGSHSDSGNGLPSYVSIPQTGYVQRCQRLNSSPLDTDLSYFKPSSHCSRNQKINLMDSETQGKKTNFKLFGQVLIPSTAPETPSLKETRCM